MASKVSNRTGAFVDFEGVTGIVEILFPPFVSNRNASRTTDFDDSKQPTVGEAASLETADCRISGSEKAMGAGEAP
ncbi:MAG TPA: hypothetical protein VIH88_12080 [Candidatus Acidoferrales bacterium]